MILLLLGLIDIFSAVLLGMMFFHIVLKTLIIIFGIILLVKGFIFIRSLASIIDLFAGASLILGLFIPSFPPVIFWIASLLLIQKGIFSFF